MENPNRPARPRLTIDNSRRSVSSHYTAKPVGGHIPPTTSQVVGFPLQQKKAAILIDGEFFSLALRTYLRLPNRPTADQIYRNAKCLVDSNTEELWRIFYYDSRPFIGHATHPVTKTSINYSNTEPAQARKRILQELGQMDFIAMRCGESRPRGWQLTQEYLEKLSQPPLLPPSADDYEMRFEQKGVDMRIGIDVATLSLNRYVDRIIVVSNDTDLIPALKLARRHGVQVVIPKIGSFSPHRDLIEDADFKRPYTPIT